MEKNLEYGVLAPSERLYSTPSALAKQLFYYVTRCGHYYCNANWNFEHTCEIGSLESHQTFLMDYIRSGTMYAETDGKNYTVDAGQILLTDCRKPHRFYTRGALERIWIHFDGSNSLAFFNQILAFHNGRACFTPYPGTHLESVLTELLSSVRNSSCTEIERSQQIYDILCKLLLPPVPRQSDSDNPIAAALDYMNQHLFEDLPASEIASRVGLSPSHFSRLFRSSTGFSPHEYLILHRIDEAKNLLHATGLSVKEIAFRTGYHSEVNFISSFTKKVGVSPTVFRNNNR